MKRYIRSGILALSLSALPLGLSALAQTGGQGYQGCQDRTTTTTREGRGSDWGWIGLLLGLLGLAGLAGRRRERLLHATARANIAQASLSQAPGKISSGRRGRLVTYNRTKSFPVAGTWTT